MKGISTWIKENYQLRDIVTSKLLRSYTNDVYLIETSASKFILKLYNPVWRSQEEILWEIDLISHLVKKNILIAGVIKTKDNKELKIINQNGKEFSAVLFEYAKGDKPKRPFTSDLYYKF